MNKIIIALLVAIVATGCEDDNPKKIEKPTLLPIVEIEPESVVEPEIAVLSWNAPTRRIDGECLTPPASDFKLEIGSNEYGVREYELDMNSLTIEESGEYNECSYLINYSYTLTVLESGPWYAVVYAIDSDGLISPASNQVTFIAP